MRQCEPCITELKTRGKFEEIIFQATCEFFDITAKQLKSPSRLRKFTEPRHMAMALILENTHLSLRLVGEMFGNRDHTTVINARRVYRNLFEKEPVFRNKVIALKKYIGNDI